MVLVPISKERITETFKRYLIEEFKKLCEESFKGRFTLEESEDVFIAKCEMESPEWTHAAIIDDIAFGIYRLGIEKIGGGSFEVTVPRGMYTVRLEGVDIRNFTARVGKIGPSFFESVAETMTPTKGVALEVNLKDKEIKLIIKGIK